MSLDWFDNVWSLQHIRNNKVIYELTKKNTLTASGESNMLQSYFRNLYSPTEFYVRLSGGLITASDTLGSIRLEPVGNGYAPQVVERSMVGFPSTSLVNGVYRMTSKAVSFSVTGTWLPISTAFLATTADSSGELVAAMTLDSELYLIAGDRFQLNFNIRLRS